ncbi:MAG: uroporphyrinogen-III synthase [Planctomycetota bacterium]|nr:MAG: uroporphyrinogen-III synthase [Planctomycetota bacterium]
MTLAPVAQDVPTSIATECFKGGGRLPPQVNTLMPHPPRIVITRAADQAEDLSQALEAIGCVPVHIPVFRIGPPSDNGSAIDHALGSDWDWCIFSSGNAVRQVMQRQLPLRARRIAVVGEVTAQIVQSYGLSVDCIPPQQDAEGLLAALAPLLGSGQRCLLPQANNARPLLRQGLERCGVLVTAPVAYRAIDLIRPEQPLPQEIRALTMASSATVARFCRLYASDLPRIRAEGSVFIAIGPHTYRALEQYDLAPRIQACSPSVAGFVAAVRSLMRQP